jgi:hypothetical protein
MRRLLDTAVKLIRRLFGLTGGSRVEQPHAGTTPGMRLVDGESLDRLYRAAIRADSEGKLPEIHGGVIGAVAWFQVALGEMEELEALVAGVLAGEGEAIDLLRLRLEEATPLVPAEDEPSPHPPHGGNVPCPIRHVNPFDSVAAGAVMGRLTGSDEEVARIAGYYLERAAPVGVALQAADRLDRGEIDLDEFARTLADLSRPAEHEDRDHSRPSQALVFPDPHHWDPCTLDWRHCAVTAAAHLADVVTDRDLPLPVTAVSPEAVCEGYSGTLVLRPAPPNLPADAGGLVLDDGATRHPLRIMAVSKEGIVVQFPEASAPGCATIEWQPPEDDLPSRVAEAAGDECRDLFPPRPVEPAELVRPIRGARAQLAIVGAPTLEFGVDGRSEVAVDACVPVTLSWSAEAALCDGTASLRPLEPGEGPIATPTGGYAVATLTADGKTLIANAPLEGSHVVAEATTTTYTLTVTTYAGPTECGSQSGTVTVGRRTQLSVSAADRVHRPGREVQVTVGIPCTAPSVGVTVSLTSNNTAALPNGTMTISPGKTTGTTTLLAGGTAFAPVQLTAKAPRHQDGVATILVGPSNCLPPGSVPDVRRYGGEWTIARRIPEVVGIHMAVLRTGKVLLFNYREGTIGGGSAAVLACVKAGEAALRACDAAWATARGNCTATRDAGKAACDSALRCATAEQCEAVTCPPCTGSGPGRWLCDIGRGACLLGCHAARGLCEAARWACKAAVDIAFGICEAAAWLAMVACKASVVVGTAACSAVGGGQAFLDWLRGGPAPDELVYNIGHQNRASCVLWDPVTNAVTTIPLGRNLFCSGHAFLADGRLLAAAGQFPSPRLDGGPVIGPGSGRGAAYDLNVFDPMTETWTRLPDMQEGRWYPTVVTLADGRVLVMSGNNAVFAGAGGTRDSIEIFGVSGDPPTLTRGPFEALPGRFDPSVRPPRFGWCYDWHFYHLYPFGHVLPDRSVFVHWKRRTANYYPSHPPGTLGWSWHWEGPLYGGPCAGQTWKATKHPFSRTGPGPGTSVILPLRPRRQPKGTLTYDPPRVMIVGGGGREAESDPPVPGEVQDLKNTDPATKSAEILDFGRPDIWGIPDWRWTGKDQANPSFMKYARVMPDTVLLPDGKVLVVNGAQVGRSGGFLIHFGAALGASQHAAHAEILDPEEQTWDELCAAKVERLYHATALLLPDARVVVAGHDGFLNMPPSDVSRYEIEVFSPPYLFRGPRPSITSAPASVTYGSSFSIGVDDASRVGSVALLRGASVTHQTNTDQRYVGLEVSQGRAPNTLSLAAPTGGGVAPPGYYMLFVVNRDGVPSVARWLRVG